MLHALVELLLFIAEVVGTIKSKNDSHQVNVNDEPDWMKNAGSDSTTQSEEPYR